MIKPRILIVEDNGTKLAEIENALQGDFELLSTRSIAGAYRLISGKWNAVVLDMTFQMSQTGGHETIKEALAGIELLQYMDAQNILIPVVVATQHSSFVTPEMPNITSIETLDAVLREAFPDIYRLTVEVDLSEEGWKHKLRAAVLKIFEERA